MRYVIFCVSALILQSCSTTILVFENEPPDNDNVFNYDQVNSRLEKTMCTVILLDGVAYNACNIHVGRDTTTFLEVDTSVEHSVGTRELSTIQHKDHFRGALSGTWIGLFSSIAASAGALILMPPGSPLGRTSGGAFVVYMAGLGTVTGFCFGAIAGGTQEYRFCNPAKDPPAVKK